MRCAFRKEGKYFNAYISKMETMNDAFLIGSINLNLVTYYPERKAEFMQLMKDCMADLIQEHSGHRPNFEKEQPAPQHERAGHS